MLTLTTIQLLWPVSNWGLSSKFRLFPLPKMPLPFHHPLMHAHPLSLSLYASFFHVQHWLLLCSFHFFIDQSHPSFLKSFIHLFKKHNFWLCWSFLFWYFSTFFSCFYYFFFLCIYFAFLFAISWDEYLAHWVFSA